MALTLSANPLTTISNMIYADWTATAPSKTDLTTGTSTAKVTVGQIPLSMRAPAIAVRTDREVPNEKAGGADAWQLFRHYIYVDVYATTDTELYNMKQEIQRILDAKRMAPGGGMHHIVYASDWRPKSHKDGGRPAFADSMRFCLVYWRIP